MTEKKLREQLTEKDIMISNLEESEAHFAEEKVKYETLYELVKKNYDLLIDINKQLKENHKLEIMTLKSELKFKEAAIDRMNEVVSKMNQNFNNINKLLGN